MRKINSIILFVVGIIISSIFCFLVSYFWNLMQKSDDVYDLTTCYWIECSGINLINGKMYNLDEIKKGKNKIEIKLHIENYSNRKVTFDFFILKDFRRVQMKQNNKIISVSRIKLDHNEKKEIVLSFFYKYRENSQVNFCLRQDVGAKSKENGYLTNTNNTENISVMFYYKNCSKYKLKVNSKFILGSVTSERKKVEIVNTGNVKVDVVKIPSNKNIKMRLRIMSNKRNDKIAIWGCVDSNQISLNNKSYLIAKTKGKCNEINIQFRSPSDSGVYEFELYSQRISSVLYH